MTINKQKILDTLSSHFRYSKKVTIDDNGLISITGNCELIVSFKELPVKFKNIGGYFDCSSNILETLEGSPLYVQRYFNCSHNNLTTLNGAPLYIGGSFQCIDHNGHRIPLTSLSGIPKTVCGKFVITVNSNTPLLKILSVVGLDYFSFYKPNGDEIVSLCRLFKEYYGTKNAEMKVGLEMMKLGYGRNARL